MYATNEHIRLLWLSAAIIHNCEVNCGVSPANNVMESHLNCSLVSLVLFKKEKIRLFYQPN